MIEIFSEIPEEVKKITEFWVEQSLSQKNALDGIKMIEEYRNSCKNEEEKAFVDFYFNMIIEKIKNEE